LAEARSTLESGDFGRAAELTRGLTADPDASAVHIRAIANLAGPSEAERAAALALARHPLSAELHFLHAVFFMDQGRDMEAVQAMRRAIYLDRSAAVAHFTLGSMLTRCGNRTEARRAYRNAHSLCAALPGDAVVPLSDGERAGRLAEAAAAQMAVLDSMAD